MPNPQQPVLTTEALAANLGLSRWTVSRVLNGHPGVAEATREKVAQAMAQSGFQPSPLARGLRGAKTGTIGCCFQEVETPALAKKMAVLQDALRQAGKRAVVEMSGGDPARERDAIQHFLGWQVDGLIIVGSTLKPEDPLIQQLQTSPTPTVLIDPIDNLGLPTIRLDREFAMRQIVKQLHHAGHTRFCLVGIASDPAFEDVRLRGLRQGASDCGLDFDHDFVALADTRFNHQDYAYGAALAEKWLQLKARPNAIIALNDRLALGFQAALRKQALTAPQDFSIIGFDNLDISPWYEPALTSVDQQIDLVMRTATNLLQEASGLDQEARDQEHLIRPVLRKRASVRETLAPEKN